MTTKSARILIVDDELAVRDLLAVGLSDEGYDCETRPNAEEAFERVKQGGLDLVLSDIDMPGANGISLLENIKAFNPDIDVIMVTGVVDTRIAIGAIRKGAADYVNKPFNFDEVAITVERVLEKRRLLRENQAYQEELESLVAERTAEVQALNQKLDSSLEHTLRALVTALDFRDNETLGHSARVVEYAVTVATEMGLTDDDSGPVEQQLTWIRRGAILHDVGKIGVSDAILHKPGKLTEDEWDAMRRHPEMGYRMLQHISFLKPALDIVLCHQERYDGTGYPRNLKGEQIPLGARIFAVVDTFDAMTSDRPYRKALSIEAARDEIEKFSGRQFDPVVAKAFLEIPAARWETIRQRVHQQVTEMEGHVLGVLGDGEADDSDSDPAELKAGAAK